MTVGSASAPWRAALLLVGCVACLACPATMHEVEGRRVFNPFYLRALESPTRESWQMPDRVVRTLGLAAGDAVADVGAGSGYFSVRFARAVGAEGRVFATDVQDEMVRTLEERFAAELLENVTVVRADFDDPSLPAGCCDLAFFANVYKEIAARPAYLRRLAAALRDGGRIAIIDFRPSAPGLGPPREVRLPESQVVAELEEAGFVLAERHDFLPRQYFLVFVPAGGDREGRFLDTVPATPAARAAGSAARARCDRARRRARSPRGRCLRARAR